MLQYEFRDWSTSGYLYYELLTLTNGQQRGRWQSCVSSHVNAVLIYKVSTFSPSCITLPSECTFYKSAVIGDITVNFN